MEQKKLEAAATRKPFTVPTVREGEGMTGLTRGNGPVLVSGPA